MQWRQDAPNMQRERYAGAGAAAVATLSLDQRVRAAESVAKAACQALALSGGPATGRVLLLGAETPSISRCLRVEGFTGERWTLLRRNRALANVLDGSFERAVISDWLDEIDTWMESVAHDEEYVPGERLADAGQFDAIIAHDLARSVPSELLEPALAWLATFVSPQGYLITCEPMPRLGLEHLEDTLLRAGLLLAADDLTIDGVWQHTVSVFQRRRGDESRLSGVLRRITGAQVRGSKPLQQALSTAYREIFGGDEWREWVRCTRPGCGKHYSRREAEALPEERCLCGWPHALEPYYTADSIHAKLRAELADDSSSRCYVRMGEANDVTAFIWGYITSAEDVTETLAPVGDALAFGRLHGEILALIEAAGGTGQAPDIYYQSEIGSLEAVRSLSLARALFYRVCRFAYDSGVYVMVTRTTRQSSAFPLLAGIGMKTLYDYATASYSSDATDMPVDSSHSTDDQRIVLGGDVRQILHMICTESDRRIALRVARYLRGEG